MANQDNYENEDQSRIGQGYQVELDPTGRHVAKQGPADDGETPTTEEIADSEATGGAPGRGRLSDGSHDDDPNLSDGDRQSETARLESLYNDKDTGKQSRAAALRGGLSKHRGKLLLAGGLGGIVAIALIFIFLLFAGLKLPNLMENIIGYQFARVSRSYAKSGARLTDSTLTKRWATRLNDTAVGQRVSSIHDKVTGVKDSLKSGAKATARGIPGVTGLLDQNDKFNPGQVARNLNGSGIVFGNDTKGRPIVTLSGSAAASAGYPKGVVFSIEKPVIGAKGFIPGYSSYLKAQNARNLINSEFVQAALNNAYAENERLRSVPTIARGLAMNKVLKRLGISRTGFLIAKYKEASDERKRAKIANEETRRAIAPKESTVPSGGPVGEAVQNADDKQKAAIAAAEKDPTGNTSVRLTGDGTAIADESVKALEQAGTRGTLNKVVSGLAGPVYQTAYLACIFNEGADANDNSQIIDANNDSNQRDFVQFADIADQQKRGPSSNKDVDAFDNGLSANQAKIGETTEDTIPLLRASGKTYDTSTEQAAQSNPYGFETPKKAIDNNFFWTVMISVKPVCPTVTSIWTAGGVALVNLVKDFVSGGGGAAADAGAEAAGKVVEQSVVKKVTSGVSKKISENIGKQAFKDGGAKLIAKNVASKPLTLLKSFVRNGAVVLGVESLGAYMGSQRSTGLNHSGYEGDATLVGQIDAGGGAAAGDLCRTMQFCRPLSRTEACQNQQDDVAFLDDQQRSQSSFQRYLATTNYQSLASRSIIKAGSTLHGPIARPLASLGDALVKPSNLIGSLLSPFSHKVLAQTTQTVSDLCDSDTGFYGNTQFGWSRDEESLIDSDPSYQLDENLGVLADAGSDKMMTIAKKYARCFGEKVADDGTLSDDPNATMGHLLTGTVDSDDDPDNPDIVRDDRGNVVADQGRCSPQNLSYKNTNPGEGDLVFRWRIANRDQNTQDQLTSFQNATSTESNAASSDNASSSSDADTGPAITGDTPTLARQVLDLEGHGITLDTMAKNDLEAASKGERITPGPIGDGSSGLPGCNARTPTALNPELLKVMLRIAAKYPYQINDIVSGHDCDTGKHPIGRAMDIFFIDGKPLNDNWWSSSTNVAVINDIGNIVHATGTYSFGYGVGCSAVSKIQSRGNLTVFNDSCSPQDEIHIDVRGAP